MLSVSYYLILEVISFNPSMRPVDDVLPETVEKAFGNLKERLNFRKMQVSSDLSLNGKLFVEFIALIYLSYVKKKMQDAKLFEK